MYAVFSIPLINVFPFTYLLFRTSICCSMIVLIVLVFCCSVIVLVLLVMRVWGEIDAPALETGLFDSSYSFSFSSLNGYRYVSSWSC